VAKGIKAFKKGMSDEDAPAATAMTPAATEPVRTLEHQPAGTATASGATTAALNDRKAV